MQEHEKVEINKKKFEDKYAKDEKYCKIRKDYHYEGEYRGAACSICSLNNSIPKEITVIIHNGSNYDYHFIIRI